MNDHPSIRELFDDLVVLDEESRRTRITSLQLRESDSVRLAALLAADSLADSILPESADSLMERIAFGNDPIDQLIGTEVASFKLIERIGEGGTSVVFRAERPIGESTQVVALKLMFAGAFSPGQQRRSLREQSILAQLSHPNIARLVEAGTTTAGMPYIAMEYVAGLPLTLSANAGALNLRQRLEQIISLCGAVDAAHAMLAVHCDLKPSNVFVDAQGQVKVLDFGVARLLDSSVGSEQTRTIALTPEYAAPEQFLPGPTTTAVDVFALGVLLSELLTGQRLRSSLGLSSQRLLAKGALDTPRGMPPRPVLARMLRGDLDGILAKATATDPTSRYRSAGALAADLQRYLDGRPVRARAWTRGYTLWKFVGRNRVSVAASLLLLATIAASAFFARGQAQIALRNAEHARQETRRADYMRDKVFELFEEAEPNVPGKQDITVAEAADQAIVRLLSETNSEPRSRLQLLERFAQTIGRHGRVDRALNVLQSAFEQSNAQLGPKHEVSLSLGARLAATQFGAGHYREAHELIDTLLPLSHEAPIDVRTRLLRRSALSSWRTQDTDRAVRDGRAAVELSRLSEDIELRLETLSDLGVVLLGVGMVDEAIQVFEELLVLNIDFRGADHAKIAMTYAALSRAHRRAFHPERAVSYAQKALAIELAIHERDHWVTGRHLNALALAQTAARKYEDALASDLESLRINTKTLPADHPDLRTSYWGVAADLMRLERYGEMLPYIEHAVNFDIEPTNANNMATSQYRAIYGYALAMDGKSARGLEQLELSLEQFETLSPPAPERHILALDRWILLALHEGRVDDAALKLPRFEAVAGQLPASDLPWWRGRYELFAGATLLADGHPQQGLDSLKRAQALTLLQPNPDAAFNVELQLMVAHAELLAGLPGSAMASHRTGAVALEALAFPPSRLTELERQLRRKLEASARRNSD